MGCLHRLSFVFLFRASSNVAKLHDFVAACSWAFASISGTSIPFETKSTFLWLSKEST